MWKKYEEEPIGTVVRRGFAGSILVETEKGNRIIMWEGTKPGTVRVEEGDFGLQHVYANKV